MEVQIRTVATIRSCFVGLPAYLIEALQETHDGFLPPMLVLELRSKGSVWHVAWIGMPSSSHSIEISAKLASCIGLPDLIEVHVRVRTDVPKALTIELEPDTEDDWEILELNAEFVEEHVLNQVGILQEGLTFPLWLRGHTVINFHVASTKPAKSVVQLVPGTELAVAPKQRKKVPIANIKDEKDGLEKKDFTVKALLRVQWLDRSLIETCKHGNVSFDVLPTSFAFVSPQTGKYFKLKNGQPVILTTASGGSKPKQDDEMHHGKKKEQNTLGGKQKGLKQTGSKEGDVEVVCQIIFQKGVARGHVMLARSLCRYIHTNLHERVIVRECLSRANEVSALLLSPISLQSFQRESINRVNSETIDVKENGLENVDDNKDPDAFVTEKEIVDWNRHQNFLSACVSSDKEGCDDSEKATCKNIVLEAWLSAATSILSKLVTGEGAGSLLIGSNTLLHFEAYSEHGTVTYDVLFLLSVLDGNENLQTDKMHVCYPDSEYCNTCFKTYHLSRESSLCKQDLKLGKPIRFLNEKESQSEGSNVPLLASLTWMDNAAQEALDRLKLILSPKSDWMFNHLNLPSLGHVLLHGPAASGKTQLALALAQHLSDNNDILAHIVIVKCSELAGEQAESLKKSLTRYVNEAIDHAPSILVLDDLDNAISASSGPDGSEPSTSMIGLSEFLADMIDSFQERRRACGLGLVAFLATVKSPEAIPDFLCSSGRFDYHVQISPPAAKERSEILRHQIQKRGLQCDDGIIADTATKCDGYDTSDLEVLVDRAIHAAASRNLSRRIENSISTRISNKPSLLKEDFRNAIENFTPAAMRGISSSGSQGGRMGWEDVGGLFDTRIAIKEMLELPVKYSKIFSEAPLRLRSGVLLYGPPGCGKTHIVGAAAAGCSLRFISVKGPELLNKYIGASEQAVRDVFTKATSAAPCILFFDEFDSIAPKRGHDNTGVTDRVVNQFLTELDGVESLTGVFVFAATSRPDLLDPALLRPGRLDRLLFCDFPNPRERLEILEVLSKKLPIASDVDLGIIASNTEGFSGADLQALLSDAQLESVHQHLNRDTEATSEHPVITNRILESVSAKARPSVSEKERERLYAIYGEFQNSRTAVSAKRRDSKGKRSTLA